MSAVEPQSQPARESPARQNVRGWERLLSIGGGLLLAALGTRKQGLRGNRQLSIGGLLLLRGLSGHCSVKSAADDPLQEIRYLRARVQRLQDLVLMAEELAQRTGAATVTPVSAEPVTPVTPVTPAAADIHTPLADQFAGREHSR